MPAKHKIGLVGAICFVVGRVIGSGIFITPTAILRHSGSLGLSLVVWLVCGLFSILKGCTYTELGTSIRLSGADFSYADYVGWTPVAFVLAFLAAFPMLPASKAVALKAFAVYVYNALPDTSNISPAKEDAVLACFGVLLLMSISFLNLYRIDRYSVAIQVFSTVTKVGGLAIIMLLAVVWAAQGKAHSLQGSFDNSTDSPGEVVLAIYLGMYAFGGQDSLNSCMEEIENPARTVPIAIVLGMSFVTAVYVATILAYHAVLGEAGLLSSSAVAQSFGAATWAPLGSAMPLIVGISIVGYVNSSTFAASRQFFTGARRGFLPSGLGLLSTATKTPTTSILYLCLATALAIQVDSIEYLIDASSFMDFVYNASSASVILWVRWRRLPVHPQAVRFPVPIHALTLLLSLVFMVMPVYQEFLLSVFGFSLLLLAFGVYAFFIRWPRWVPGFLVRWDRAVALALQKTFLCVTDYDSYLQVISQLEPPTEAKESSAADQPIEPKIFTVETAM